MAAFVDVLKAAFAMALSLGTRFREQIISFGENKPVVCNVA
jgi:hypothetical protein